MFSVHGLSREQLRFVPDEHNGAVAGRLVVLDPDRETGEVERIDCTRFGSGAYTIPSLRRSNLSFETDAKFILAIETGGIFQRLQSTSSGRPRPTASSCLDERACPTRATRRFVRQACPRPMQDPRLRLRRLRSLRHFSNIYRTLKVGSGQHGPPEPASSACRKARFLGVTPQDILDYELPTHPLLDVDVKRAKDALKNDPFFQAAASPGSAATRASWSRWAYAPSSRPWRNGA